MKRYSPPDWPVIATAFAARLPPSVLHPAAMDYARQDQDRTKRRGHRPRWAVAFSGGADSLALLLVLWAEGPGRWGRDFVAMHFDHRLRGRESSADARFCRDVCRALGVRLVAGSWDRGGRRRAAVGEAEARAARHKFFAREMGRRRIRLLWLGHQQDDIAETMLMRLARGSGTGGLAAPRPVQPQADGRVHLRPLLTLRKDAIKAALRAAGATWREDASNASDDFFRNRVRRSIIPAWAKAAGRDVRAAAALTRERLEEDDTALECWLDELAPVERKRTLRLDRLAGRPLALWRRALHRWLLAVRPDTDLSRQGFEQLLAAVRRGRDTRFSLGTSGFAVVQRGKLVFRRGR
jgi:tRNA(Ile)-lysidine synthase